MTKNRVQQGVPTGGQFAATPHDEADISLAPPANTGPDQTPVRRGGTMIDLLTGRQVSGVVNHGPGSVTAQVCIDGKPAVGIIYDSDSDTGESGSGDPVLVVWNDDGDAVDFGGGETFSLHKIPGMTSYLEGIKEKGAAPPITIREAPFTPNGRSAKLIVGDVVVCEAAWLDRQDQMEMVVFDLAGDAMDVGSGKRFALLPKVKATPDEFDRDIKFHDSTILTGSILGRDGDDIVIDAPMEPTGRIQLGVPAVSIDWPDE